MYVVQIMVTNINKDVVNSLLCGHLSLEMSRWTILISSISSATASVRSSVCWQSRYSECRHRWRRAWTDTALSYNDCCCNVYRSVIYTSSRRSSVRPYIRWSPGCCMNVAVWVPRLAHFEASDPHGSSLDSAAAAAAEAAAVILAKMH